MTNAPTDELTPPPPVDVHEPIKHGRERWVKYFERQYLSKLLEAHRGNVTAAAKAAGIDRGHFYRLLFRCGLRGNDTNGSSNTGRSSDSSASDSSASTSPVA